MTRAEPRNAAQRKADTIAKLREHAVDAWVATASAIDGGGASAHLVPLSLAWIDDSAVIALEVDSVTCRNIVQNGAARLGIGPTRDVVLIDAVLAGTVPIATAPVSLAEQYAAQADWDPRTAGDTFVYLVLHPERVQAWREANELPGRTLMRGGVWLA